MVGPFAVRPAHIIKVTSQEIFGCAVYGTSCGRRLALTAGDLIRLRE